MPDPYTIDPSGLDVPEAMNMPVSVPTVRGAKVVLGHIGAGLVATPAIPTALYTLGSDAIQWLTKEQGNSSSVGLSLPGVEGARAWTSKIDKEAYAAGSDFAGEPLQPRLLNNNDTANKIGTGLGIVTGMVPMGGPVYKGFKALKDIDTGIAAVNATKNIALEAAAFISPIQPVANARTGAMLAGGNAVIGGGLQSAADATGVTDTRNAEMQQSYQGTPDAPAAVSTIPATTPTPASPELVASDDEIKATMDQFVQQTNATHAQLNTVAAHGTDVSMAGVVQVKNAVQELDIHNEMENLIRTSGASVTAPKIVTAGINDEGLGEYKEVAGALSGLALLAGGAYLKRDVIRGASIRAFGGKEFSKDAAKDAVTKVDNTGLSVADTMKSQAVDASTPLVRNTSDPEHVRAMFENIGAAKDVHFSRLRESGEFANSNVKLNNTLAEIEDHFVTKIAPDPAKLKLLNDAANASTEVQNRNRMWLEKVKPPGLVNRNVLDPLVSTGYRNSIIHQGASEADTSFNMLGTPYRTLEATRAAGLADPDIKRGLDMLADITRKTMQYRLEQGAITAREYHDLLRTHPVYFPTRQDASHMSPLKLSPGGGREVPGNIVDEIMPYLGYTVRDVAESRLRTTFIMEARANNASFIGRTLKGDQENVKNADKYVHWRDANANPMMTEVTDPLIRASLASGAGSGAIRMNAGILKAANFPSRVLEVTSTHPLTAVVGHFQAPITMAYGIMSTAVNKQKGMVFGPIDKFLQDTAGVKFGLPGDPLAIPQVLIQAGINLTATLALHGGRALESVPHSSWLGKAMGGASLDALGKAMSAHYKASMLYETKSQGLHGGAHWMNSNLTDNMKGLDTVLHARNRATGGAKAVFDFIYDTSRAVADSPQTSFYKQNKGRVSQELLTTRTRNVMGDPAKAGLAKSEFGAGSVGLVNFFPWGGVSLQTFSRLMESARTNPAGVATALTMTIGIPSFLASNHNVSLGPEYVKYQHEGRTTDQVSGSLYIGQEGKPPEQGFEIPLDQPVRPFFVLSNIIWGHMYGLFDGSIFKPENEWMRRALVDSTANRYGGAGGEAMSAAFGQILPGVPPLVNIGLGALGKEQLRSLNAPSTPIQNVNKYAGASESSSSTIDNKWFGYPMSAQAEATIQSTTGVVGRAMYEMLTAHFQGKKDGLSSGDQFSDYQDRFGMQLNQSTRVVSPLWGHSATLSPSQESAAKALSGQMETIRKLDAASKKLRGLSGASGEYSGAKGRSIDALAGSGPVQFADPEMAKLANSASNFVTQYDKLFSGPIKDLYQQRMSIQSSEKVPPSVKRTMMNDNAKEIVDQNRKGLAFLEQWKWRMSKVYNRDIDPRTMKVDGPIIQFKPLMDVP